MKRLAIFICFLLVTVQVYAEVNSSKKLLILNPNEIFYVRDNYNLNGEAIDVPKGCVLKFDGGSIINGTLSSPEPFIIEAGLTQIFKNVKFTIERYNTIKIQAEWFGVERRNTDIENSKNLQDLFNSCKSLHVAFQDGVYRFSIDYPVTSYGRTTITGECAAHFSDTPRTWLVINGAPSEPKFFLTCDTERTTLKHVMFLTLNGNDYRKFSNIGAVFFRDIINPGNIDSAIDACMFYNVGCPVKAYGRGLSITNTRIQESGGIILKQTKSDGNNLSQQPPFDGRGFFMDNIRVHWLTRGLKSGVYSAFGSKNHTLLTILHNNEVEHSAFFGVIMNNIYADGACQLMDCDSDMNSLIMTNVFCARPLQDFLHFKRNVSNLILSKMIIENAYHYISDTTGDQFVTFNGDVQDCILSDNIFGGANKEIIKVSGNGQHLINNFILNNNIFKGGRGILALENVDVTSLRILNNTLSRTKEFDHELRILGDETRTSLRDYKIEN